MHLYPGIYGFPNDRSAGILLEETNKFLEKRTTSIDMVEFCIIDDDDKLLQSRWVQKRVLTVVKKTSADMKESTGVDASMNEGEMKDYVELVIKELRSK